jgi:carboxymethylenebutenolidase
MKRSILVMLAIIALASSFGPGSARAGMISFTEGSTKVNAYLALPQGEGTHPAVIVIHEWWGLNDWVKEQADRLAKEGYIALAVDIYHGQIAKDDATAHQLMSGLDENEALTTLRSATDFLRGRSDVRANAIGVIGWCMGGGYSIRLAAADPGIRACVMYYGAPISDPAAIRGLQAAILGNFGGEDKGPSPDQVRTFEKALKKAGKRVDFKIYPGAPHAFANVHNPWGGYREAAAKDAWLRTKGFLRRELKLGSLPKRSRVG